MPEEVIHALFVFVVARKHPPFVFQSVAERNVRDVVSSADTRISCSSSRETFVRAADRFQDPMRHPRRAQRMLKARMHRRRKNQVGRTELFDAPQPLEFRRIDQFDFQRADFDVPVHRVANQFSFTHVSDLKIGASGSRGRAKVTKLERFRSALRISQC